MAQKFSSLPRGVKIGAALVLAVGLAWTLVARASQDPVAWDAQASAELEAALHAMHEVWNTGDIAALKQHLVGDEVLVTFELDPVTHEPIRLDSKKALWEFVDGIVADLDSESAVSILGHPKVACRATDSFGVCTEQCDVKVEMPDGVVEHHSLLSTATAVRYEDGWKWIQWHMSTGGPVKTYKDGELVAVN